MITIRYHRVSFCLIDRILQHTCNTFDAKLVEIFERNIIGFVNKVLWHSLVGKVYVALRYSPKQIGYGVRVAASQPNIISTNIVQNEAISYSMYLSLYVLDSML